MWNWYLQYDLGDSADLSSATSYTWGLSWFDYNAIDDSQTVQQYLDDSLPYSNLFQVEDIYQQFYWLYPYQETNLESQTIVGGTVYTQSLTGSLTSTGGISKSILRTLVASLTVTGSISKSILRTLTASLTGFSPLTRLTTIATPLAGSITPSATLSTKLLFTKLVSGSMNPSGNIANRAITKVMIGSIVLSGVIANKTSKTLVGSMSLSGNVFKGVYKSLQGALTFTATFVSRYSTSRAVGGILQAFASLATLFTPYTPPNSTEDSQSTPKHLRKFQGRR